MKHTIFFDLGNVLIFFSHKKMCKQVAEYCGLDLKQVDDLLLGYLDPYERGHLDSQTLYRQLSALSKKKLDFDTLMRAIGDIFEPNLPVIAIAQELKKRGHRLFLLSNTCDAHFSFAYSQFPFLKEFDGYVLSYEVGARKPEKQIYEKALEIAGCRNIHREIQRSVNGNVGASDLQQAKPLAKQDLCKHKFDAASCKDEDADEAIDRFLNHDVYKECFYTDDILAYVEGARALGIDAEQYKTPEELIQHLNVRKLL